MQQLWKDIETFIIIKTHKFLLNFYYKLLRKKRKNKLIH